MSSTPSVLGRLAPSPNGLLHLGHARSFLLAWWSARSQGGGVALRLDDLDPSRCRPEYEAGVLRDLEWLGLDWDGPIIRQSERTAQHRAAAQALLDAGLAYPCVCTRREVLLAAPHLGEEGPIYPGTCRGLYADLESARQASGREPLLRFRVPSGPIEIEDRFLGAHATDLAQSSGDFPIFTREGLATYQLATAVDDQSAGVNEVLRGDDLLTSAHRQAALQDALGFPRPTWIHVPLMVEQGGHRLAKRSGDRPLSALRDAGVDPRLLVDLLAASAGQAPSGRQGPAPIAARFHLGLLPPEPFPLDASFRASLGLQPAPTQPNK